MYETYSVDIADDSGNARETRTPSWHNAHVLKGVLTRLSFAVCVIVQVCDSFSQSFKLAEYGTSCTNQPYAPLTPVVGAYSSESTGIGIESGLGGAPGMGPTSGAP